MQADQYYEEQKNLKALIHLRLTKSIDIREYLSSCFLLSASLPPIVNMLRSQWLFKRIDEVSILKQCSNCYFVFWADVKLR